MEAGVQNGLVAWLTGFGAADEIECPDSSRRLAGETVNAQRERTEELPEDYDGLMHRAQVLAICDRQMPAAAELVEHLLDPKQYSVEQRANALFNLAAWNYIFARDDSATRTIYLRMIALFAGTRYAETARQRLLDLGSFSRQPATGHSH